MSPGPPLADEQVERFAIGLLIDPNAPIDLASTGLDADHFTGARRVVFETMLGLQAGETRSLDALAELVRGRGGFATNLYEWLMEARDAGVTLGSITEVLSRYRNRRALDAFGKATKDAALESDPYRFDVQWKELTEGGALAATAAAFGFPSAPYTPSLQETNRRDVPPRWVPRPLSALAADHPEIPWVWQGYLARGCQALLTGIWKGGKTTLLGHLLRSLDPLRAAGDFAGRGVTPGSIVVVTEESEALWVKRRETLGLGDHVLAISRPFLRRPLAREWEAFVTFLAEQVCREGHVLVIFDTISSHWPVVDENDAGQVKAALAPIAAIMDADAAVLHVHHPSKGDGTEGRASRGSGALPATVDILVELRCFDPQRAEDRRRVLTAWGRFDETPAELVIDYHQSTGYRALGARREAAAEGPTAGRRRAPPAGPLAAGRRSTCGVAPEDAETAKPGERTLRQDLDGCVARNLLKRCGSGRRGDPYLYALFDATDSFPATPGSLGGNESETGWLPGNVT